MEITPEQQKMRQGIMTELEPHMKEGITYHFTTYVYNNSTVGGDGMYYIKDGARYKEGEGIEAVRKAKFDLSGNHSFFPIAQSFPDNTKIIYSLQKGEAMKVEVFSPKMLVEEIKRMVIARAMELNRIKTEANIKLIDRTSLKFTAKEESTDGKEIFTSKIVPVYNEIPCLYHATGKQLKKLYYRYENDEFTIEGSPAMPEIGIGEIVKITDTSDFNPRKLESIYTYLESGDEDKIATALAALKKSKSYTAKAESRYLNLIRAKLNDPEATMAQAKEGLYGDFETEILLGKNLGSDFISFGYYDDDESKAVVDFIGAMVADIFDVETFCEEAKNATDEKQLVDLVQKYEAMIKPALVKKARTYKTGWYSKICKKLSGMKVAKVLFDHSQFNNDCFLFLKEFWFFTSITFERSIYIDIHQSDPPYLTEIFWMLRKIPVTNWSDVEYQFPDSPLKFKRNARLRIGDTGRWKTIKRPE